MVHESTSIAAVVGLHIDIWKIIKPLLCPHYNKYKVYFCVQSHALFIRDNLLA